VVLSWVSVWVPRVAKAYGILWAGIIMLWYYIGLWVFFLGLRSSFSLLYPTFYIGYEHLLVNFFGFWIVHSFFFLFVLFFFFFPEAAGKRRGERGSNTYI
jgi:hypothetical protein